MADPYRETKTGKPVKWWDAHTKVKSLNSSLELWVRRMIATSQNDDSEMWGYYLESVELALDSLSEDIARWRELLESERARIRKREQIANLRNTAGRSPAEAAEFHRKADELEAQVKGERQ